MSLLEAPWSYCRARQDNNSVIRTLHIFPPYYRCLKELLKSFHKSFYFTVCLGPTKSFFIRPLDTQQISHLLLNVFDHYVTTANARWKIDQSSYGWMESVVRKAAQIGSDSKSVSSTICTTVNSSWKI